MHPRGREDGIENLVETLARILGEKPQDEVFVLLKESVFPAIPPIRFSIAEMLRAVDLDDEAGIRAKEIHFHAVQSYRKGSEARH